MTRTRVTWVATLYIMAIVVQALGGTSVAAPAAQEDKVKIVYWSMFSQGEPLMLVLDQATQDFMAENPDIEVEINWAGRAVLTQLQSAIAAGTQVDIVDQGDAAVFNALVANDLALPLDTYLAEPAYDSDQAWQDTFLPGSFDMLTGEDGHIYMVPRDDYISGLFYDTRLLNELELEPQTVGMTWDQFLSMLDTIQQQKPDVSPLGADANVAGYNNWWFTYLAIRLAGQDAFRAAAYDKTGELWSQPEFLQAAQMVRELQDRNYFQEGFEGSVWPAAQALWVQGRVAMLLIGAGLPKEMSQQMPEGFQADMFAFPTVEGGKGNDLVEHWANVYAVLKSSEHPDEAVRYLKYILSKKVGTQIAEAGTPIPLVDIPPPPALAGQYEILAESTQMPQRAGLVWEIPNYIEQVYNICNDSFFQRQIGPEEFISCLQTTGQEFWAQ